MKHHWKLPAFFLACMPILVDTQAEAGEEPVWVLDGFTNPEAVLASADGSFVYVSDTNGGPSEKNGLGYIARVGLDGALIERVWAEGLDAPKGMLVFGDHLYVTDIDRIVALDLDDGTIVEEWRHGEGKYLNGLTLDADGRIYASDTAENKIFRVADNQLELWVDDAALDYPNGLRFEDGRILVAGWGKPNPDWTTDVPGHLKAVDIETGAITSVSDGKPIGNLDGIKTDDDGNWLVTDFMGGAVYRIDRDGETKLVLSLKPGSADFEYLQSEGLAIIPMFLDGKVVAHRIE